MKKYFILFYYLIKFDKIKLYIILTLIKLYIILTMNDIN